MAEPYHNILSKTSRALAAYLIARGVGDSDTVLPLKSAKSKAALPLVICAATSYTRASEDPGYYMVRASVIVRTAAAIDLPQDDVDAPVDASDEFQGNVFDAFKIYITDDNDDSSLATQITTDARAVGGDLEDFTCIRVMDMGGAVETNEQGTFWDDTMNLELICIPRNVS